MPTTFYVYGLPGDDDITTLSAGARAEWVYQNAFRSVAMAISKQQKKTNSISPHPCSSAYFSLVGPASSFRKSLPSQASFCPNSCLLRVEGQRPSKKLCAICGKKPNTHLWGPRCDFWVHGHLNISGPPLGCGAERSHSTLGSLRVFPPKHVTMVSER